MMAINIPKNILVGCVLIFICSVIQAKPKNGMWTANIHREDGKNILFQFRWEEKSGKNTVSFINGEEHLITSDVSIQHDSIEIHMPVFESYFKFKLMGDDSLSGYWIRNLPNSEMRIPSTARHSDNKWSAFAPPSINVSGKYAISFENKNDKSSPAIIELNQRKGTLSGSILTPTGDYRYMNGMVINDSIFLHTFDGVHAVTLSGKIDRKNFAIIGEMWSGATSHETFSGKKDANPILPNTSEIKVRDGESGRLDFSFKDLDGNMVSINDQRFKNKVVIIDIMGSWCPNCMDETAFLSDFYKKNKNRGIEVIGLAYEYSTDFARSQKSIRKFQKKFNVTYPMLITGVTVMDPQRTEKTLPQLTPIKMFPSTIVLDKTGKVAFIDTGFQGPATGQYYTDFVKDFNKKIDQLLK